MGGGAHSGTLGEILASFKCLDGDIGAPSVLSDLHPFTQSAAVWQRSNSLPGVCSVRTLPVFCCR